MGLEGGRVGQLESLVPAQDLSHQKLQVSDLFLHRYRPPLQRSRRGRMQLEQTERLPKKGNWLSRRTMRAALPFFRLNEGVGSVDSFPIPCALGYAGKPKLRSRSRVLS